MNVGSFMFSIAQSLMTLGKKLYSLWNYEMSIEWVQKILNFFGIEEGTINLPNTIGLNWIFTSASAALIFVLIIYRMFK